MLLPAGLIMTIDLVTVMGGRKPPIQNGIMTSHAASSAFLWWEQNMTFGKKCGIPGPGTGNYSASSSSFLIFLI